VPYILLETSINVNKTAPDSDANNSGIKKKVYLVLTMILLMVFAYFIHQLASIFFNSKTSYFFAIVAISIIGGVSLGNLWWQIVYVERRHRKFIKEDKSISQSQLD